jgi:esterase/lipase superfamily enzyme
VKLITANFYLELVMIIIVSNRKVNPKAKDDSLFGEEPNQKSLDELRLAVATYKASSKSWSLELLPESDPVDGTNPPSKQLFDRMVQSMDAGQCKGDWVVFVHGFNHSFPENLTSCRRLEEKYGVNVIAFSWPSNPGGFVNKEYRDARQAARASSNAIDRFLEKLGRYLQERSAAILRDPQAKGCAIRLNLLAHSLGNYLFEDFIREPIFNGETRIFDNVILHQADVDNHGHTEWIDKVNSKRIYVTLNERDSILKAANAVNSPRLGNTVENLKGQRPIYVDFTGAKNIEAAHNLFLEVKDNLVLQAFCQRLLSGDRGETLPQFQYIASNNTYRIVE